jgi:hypothetical protein
MINPKDMTTEQRLKWRLSLLHGSVIQLGKKAEKLSTAFRDFNQAMWGIQNPYKPDGDEE